MLPTVSMDRLFRVFSTQPEVCDPEPERAVDPQPQDVRGEIAYKGVEFGYVPGTRVINRLDLTIRPGEMIGVVGVTGAGKSSLMSLLCRFYDVTEGAIEIDGVDVRRFPQAKLHRIIGLVQQVGDRAPRRDRICIFQRLVIGHGARSQSGLDVRMGLVDDEGVRARLPHRLQQG